MTKNEKKIVEIAVNRAILLLKRDLTDYKTRNNDPDICAIYEDDIAICIQAREFVKK
jgi:hypothetical protein